MLRYLGEHFRGGLPLALSFWVNFIVPAAALYAAGALLHDTAAADIRFLDELLAFLVLSTLIYTWQVCGVWRASENALLNHAWFAWARGAQTVVVLSVLVYLGQVMGYAHLVHQGKPRQRAADGEFLERILNTPSTAMWFPSHDELLAAGVVHEVRILR